MESTILTPGFDDEEEEIIEEVDKHLLIDNFLSEYDTPGKKAVIRENLNVYSKDDIYSKDELDTHVAESVNKIVSRHSSLKDPHKVIPQVRVLLYDYMKQGDAFTKPQVGVDPISDNHLATKGYVDDILLKHLIDEEAYLIKDTINREFKNYPFFLKVYDQVYTKKEVNDLLSKYQKIVKNNKQLTGPDPTQDNHLATKRYVDKLLYEHLIDKEAHIKEEEPKIETYTKEELYTKKEVEELVAKVVTNVLTNTVDKLKDNLNKKLNNCNKELSKCVKQVDFEEYVTLKDLDKILEDNVKIILNELDSVEEKIDLTEETHYLEGIKSIAKALKILDQKIYELLK